MYSTCIFCHAALGANEAIEHFPVGRRLAFDAARGRLWVVCRKCERWNLAPLEERWEAIEECERGFRGTKLRVSTDQIGLARLREGLELVRIGQPQRPEMAAWRYGDQFGRRRRRHVVQSSLLISAGVGLFVAGPLMGAIVGGSAAMNIFSLARSIYFHRRTRARLPIAGRDAPILLRDDDLRRAWIGPAGEGWALNLTHRTGRGSLLQPARKTLRLADYRELQATRLTGDDALRAIGQVLPMINPAGGRRDQVQSAIELIERTGDHHALFRLWVTPHVDRARMKRHEPGPEQTLGGLPREVLLAFEMASHEETERRALEGELSLLEDAWRDAEEIAAIADDLFVSAEARRKLAAHRRDESE